MSDVHERVFAALSASGVRGTHLCWPKGQAPALPWFCYGIEDGGEWFADDSNASAMPRVWCELYESSHDAGVESAMAAAVAAIGPYTSDEEWLDDEHALVTTYHFTLTPDRRETSNG